MMMTKQTITTPSHSRQGMIKNLLSVLVILLLWPASLWAGTEYVSNGKVRYNVGSYGFNIQFYYNGDWKRTTFSDLGYYTYISINDAEMQVVNGSSQLVLGHPYTIDGIEVTITLSFPDVNGSAVSIQYTVTNTTDLPVSIKLGSCGDTQVGNNDGATVSVEENQNGQKFIVMKDDETGAEYKISAGVGDLAFTRMWYGGYSGNSNGSSYTNHVFDNESNSHSSGDTALAWSWDITIPAGATVRRYAGGGGDVLSLQSGFVVMNDYTYGETPSTPSVSDIASVSTHNETPTIVYYYNTTNSNVGGTAWSSSITGTDLPAGTYYMYAVLNSTPHYNTFTTAPEAFKVNKKAVKVSGITASNKVYDGYTSATLITTGAAFDGLIAGDALTVSATGTFADKNVGTEKTVNLGTLTLGGTSVGNYQLAETGNQATTTANITARTLTITAEAKSKTYGEADPTLTYTSSGLVDGDNMTGSLSRAEGENVGTYAITQGSLTAGSNYSITYTGANLTISQANLTVTANPKTITYGDEPANDGVTYSGFVNSETSSVLGGELAYAYTYTQYGDVGSYYITPSGQTSSNYNITFGKGTLTVGQREVTLSWDDTDLTYNRSAQKPTATAGNLVNGDVCTVTVEGEQTDAGTGYTATASALSNTNYKLPSSITQTFNIGQKSVTVSDITASNKVYDGNTSATVITTGAAFDGLIDGDELNVSTTGTFADADVGTGKTVTLGTLTLGGTSVSNYQLAATGNQATTTADITAKALTITAEAKSKTYGEVDPTLTYTYNPSELIGSDAITGALSRDGGEDVGTYAITLGSLTAGGNYSISYTGANLTIDPRSLATAVIALTTEATAFDFDGTHNVEPDITSIMLNSDVIASGNYTVGYSNNSSVGTGTVTITGTGNYCGTTSLDFDITKLLLLNSSYDWLTYYGLDNLEIPSGYELLTVSDASLTDKTVTTADIDYIPSGTPVVLHKTGMALGTYHLKAATGTAPTVFSGFTGVTVATAVDALLGDVQYILVGDEFVKLDVSEGGSIAANRCYLYFTTGAAPARLKITGESTGIESRTADSEEQWYDLNGRKLSGKPTKKGLYILNNKKVVIK